MNSTKAKYVTKTGEITNLEYEEEVTIKETEKLKYLRNMRNY